MIHPDMFKSGDKRTRVRRQWTRMTPTPAAIDGFIGYFCDPSSPSNGERSFIRSNAHSACRVASVRSFGQRLPTLLRNFLSTSALLMGRSANPGA